MWLKQKYVMTENEANDKLKALIKDNPHLIMSRDTC